MTPDRINTYAMIGDLRTGALIGEDGSLEWLCLPRFDSAAQFASLLGTAENGLWTLAPAEGYITAVRRYEESTLVLETTYTTQSGSAKVVDFMPLDTTHSAVVRVVEGITGTVTFATRYAPRMSYGSIPPLGERADDVWITMAAPDALAFRSSVPFHTSRHDATSTFTIAAGERVTLTLQWYSAFEMLPEAIDAYAQLEATRAWWQTWSAQFSYEGRHRELVLRSAIALKALSSRAHGSFVAALTTSLPEKFGESLNWDYRFAWLRDCAFSVESLMRVGFRNEAEAWRTWFSRTYAGCTPHLKVMYAVDGGHVAAETELPWLAGFEASTPVRVGNDARVQFQLGVYGNVLTSFERAQRNGLVFDEAHWALVTPLLEFLEENWKRTDSGIWEQRDNLRQFVDSKVMVWVGIERALRMAERGNLPIDEARWKALSARVHDEICRAGYDSKRNTFTQAYGSHELDASVLLLVILGFLPPDDPRIVGTVDAIEDALYDDGYVYRYTTDEADGIRKEGSFAICGFWLVKAYVMLGRRDKAEALFERLIATASDLGLFAEEYSATKHVALGNYPQAFSHAGLIEAACSLYNPSR